ncbi:MAG: CNNM domain-containing protein [Helicobacteraceae bacterium]
MGLLLIYLFTALFFSFICSILEAVLLSVTPSFVELAIGKNPRGGNVLKAVKQDIDRSISAILTLNTIAHTIGAAGVGAQSAKIFGDEFMLVTSMLLTLLILYSSEIFPKVIGAVYWKKLAIVSAYAIRWMTVVTYPFIVVGSLITKVFKQDSKHKISREEILAIAEMGEKDGVVSEQESDLLEKLFDFKDTRVKDVMTPTTVVFAVPRELSVADYLKLEDFNTFSRIPVYDKNIDNVIGIVLRNALFLEIINGNSNRTVGEITKPVFHISESIPLTKALDLFIKRKEHIFIAHDSYGQTMGIVTLEDAIETLLGVEIMDELDKVEDLQALAKKKLKERMINNGN